MRNDRYYAVSYRVEGPTTSDADDQYVGTLSRNANERDTILLKLIARPQMQPGFRSIWKRMMRNRYTIGVPNINPQDARLGMWYYRSTNDSADVIDGAQPRSVAESDSSSMPEVARRGSSLRYAPTTTPRITFSSIRHISPSGRTTSARLLRPCPRSALTLSSKKSKCGNPRPTCVRFRPTRLLPTPNCRRYGLLPAKCIRQILHRPRSKPVLLRGGALCFWISAVMMLILT